MKFIYSILIIIFTLGAFSQLTIEGQVRPRSEYRNGFKTLNGDQRSPAFFTEQRTRLNLNFMKDDYELYISLQDVRIWGETTQIYKADPTLSNINQAWGKYNFNPNFSFKVGRQVWSYDIDRFLGSLDWAQQGRSHDGLLLSYLSDSKKFRADAGFAYNQNPASIGVFEPGLLTSNFYNGNGNYKSAAFLWLNHKTDNLNSSLLIHNDGRQVQADGSMAYRQTFGLTIAGQSKPLDYGGEVYYQMGDNAVGSEISAFMVNAYIKIKTKLTPIEIGADYLSGNSLDDFETDNAFAPLYGTNHKFYGFMDYFYVGNPHGQVDASTSRIINPGLIDGYLKTKWKLGEKNALLAHLHYFMSPSTLFENANTQGAEADAYLGTELDLVYVVALTKDIKINLGYSHMLAGESMSLIKSTGEYDATQNWAWLQFDFKPTLFTN